MIWANPPPPLEQLPVMGAGPEVDTPGVAVRTVDAVEPELLTFERPRIDTVAHLPCGNLSASGGDRYYDVAGSKLRDHGG